MSRILVVDDDPEIRRIVRAYLHADGHAVVLASDGAAGVQAAAAEPPDLILTDVQMPILDGFGLFGAVRSHPPTARVPVVLMTAHNNREMLLKALRAGVDDFVGKPFDRRELLDVVAHRLKLASDHAGREPQPAAPPQPAPTARPPEPAPAPAAAPGRREATASVVVCEVCGLEPFASVLKPEETAELLAKFAAEAEEAVRRQGGRGLKVADDRFVATFEDESATNGGPHALRAVRGALAVVLAAQRLKPWSVSRFGRDVPQFAVSLGVHSGPVVLPDTAAGAALVRGPVADLASALAESGRKLRWSIVASRDAAQAAGFAFLSGRSAKLQTPGSAKPTPVVEVKGLDQPGSLTAEQAKLVALVEAAVEHNAGLITFAQALARVRSRKTAAKAPAAPAAAGKTGELVEGYAVVRKLAENGLVSVYLAQPARGGPEVVLKMIPIGDEKKRAQLERFVTAYAAVGTVDHPDIARSPGQGLTASHVYIAQEYCPGGDLRNLIAERMRPDDAMKALLRLAGGLKAAHQKGIVHGDLKPANVMIRADGSFAITDFSLARIVEYAMGEAASGVMVRSPDYLSPELINGQPADMQTDLYTLGLLLHEMLTGRRPYASPDLSRVIMDHLSSPVPKLPEGIERFQPLLERLMAKNRDERFASVQEAITYLAREGAALAEPAPGVSPPTPAPPS